MPQNLIADPENAVKELLRLGLTTTSVESVGMKDINAEGQIVFRPPAVRTLYGGSDFKKLHDNLALTYQGLHLLFVLAADTDTHSAEAQREASKHLMDNVLPLVVGARVQLSDSEQLSDPIELLEVKPYAQDEIGSIYIAAFLMPCIAQFSGQNNPTLP